MKIHKLYMLRPRELREIYASIGGKYSYKDRIDREGTGSPLLYYAGGHPYIDELNERATDELRINFEEFKNGLMLGIAERTNPYIMPLKHEDIQAINLKLKKEQVAPLQRSLFSWLLNKGIKLSIARFFANAREYQEAKTEFNIETKEHTIYCWTTGPEFMRMKKFFEKSNFKYLLNVQA